MNAERAFSCGHLTVSRLQHSLGGESVRPNTVLGSRTRIPELILEDDIVDCLADKKGKDSACTDPTDADGDSIAWHSGGGQH